MPELKRAAIHEAGHACWCLLNRQEFIRVEVTQEGDSYSGALIFAEKPQGRRATRRRERRIQWHARKVAEHFMEDSGTVGQIVRELNMDLVNLSASGPLAEYAILDRGEGSIKRHLNGPDGDSLSKWGAVAIASGAREQDVFRSLERTASDLCRHQRFILALAARLEEKGHVGYEEVKNLFQEIREEAAEHAEN